MNRPHIVALLDLIADDVAIAALAFPERDEPAIKAEVDRLISELVKRLRVRAGAIEAGQN